MLRRPTAEETRALALTAERMAEQHARAGCRNLHAMWRRIAERLRRDAAHLAAA